MRYLTVAAFLFAGLLGTCTGVTVAAAVANGRVAAQNPDPFCTRNPAACAAQAQVPQPQPAPQVQPQVVVPAPQVSVNPTIENKGQPIVSDTVQWVLTSIFALLTGSHIFRTFKPTGNVKADLQALLHDPALKTQILQAVDNAVNSGVPGGLIQTAGAGIGAGIWEPILRRVVGQALDARLGAVSVVAANGTPPAPSAVSMAEFASTIGDLVTHLKDLVATLKGKQP